ncbi:MAG: hypothetical protein ACRDGD_07000 [Candidatus Limnocylindria bacterium]
MPDTPIDFEGSELDYLAQINGISTERAQQMLDRVTGSTPARPGVTMRDAAQHRHPRR